MKRAIVLAAGKGTRMKSELPKVLHEVNGKTMIRHILDSLKEANVDEVVTIVGYRYDLVKEEIDGLCDYAIQEPQLGTGHAVMQAKQFEDKDGITVVANGDCPCIRPATYENMYEACEDADMVVLTAMPEDTLSYGRVVRDEEGNVEKIVEYKDASEEERDIKEINTGIYAFNNKSLFEGLKKLSNDNAQNEYYITDLVEILKNDGKIVKAVLVEDYEEVQGINDINELKHAEEYLKSRDN